MNGDIGRITGAAGAGLNGGFLVWVDILPFPVEIKLGDDGWYELPQSCEPPSERFDGRTMSHRLCWLIERRQPDGEWDTVGSIEAPSAAAAVYAAQAWPRTHGYPLRAVPWKHLTAEQKSAARYEDEMRDREGQGYGWPGTQTAAPVRDKTPDWVRDLPPHIALTSYQVERLELIRANVGVEHTEFHLHILSNPECGKMFQRQQFRRVEQERPGLTPEMYVALLILMRLASARLAGGDLFDLRARFPDSTPDDDERLLAAVFEIMREKDIHDADQLAVAIREYEEAFPSIAPVRGHPSTREARRQITLILAESNQR